MTLIKCNTMQKIINVLAVLSFAGVAGIVGGGTYVYFQRDALIESAKEKITAAATEAIAGALPGMLDAAMPRHAHVYGARNETDADQKMSFQKVNQKKD